MDITTQHMQDRIKGLEAVLLQMRRVYTNPDMHQVIDLALLGEFTKALYPRYLHYYEGGGTTDGGDVEVP